MRRLMQIGLCLLIVTLPVAGLSATTSVCDEGIGAAPSHGCSNCCCEPAVCACEIAPAPTLPTNSPTTLALVLPPAGLPYLAQAAVAPLAVAPSIEVRRVVCHAPFQPENRLERLHVLQI